MLKIPIPFLLSVVVVATAGLLAGCANKPFTESDDHQVNVLTSVEDTKPLSLRVREALRNNGQTAVSNIRVSQDSDDTVKLSGFVSNDAVKYEAERVAYQVAGVRFVVNNLDVDR